MRLTLAALVLMLASPVLAAEGPAPTKELPAATEAAWVAAVKDYRTADSTTVLQALRYAEGLRPEKFKLGSFDAVARLVEAGVGAAVLPLAAVERHRGPDLAELRLTDDWADRRLALCARNFAELSAHARLLAEKIARASAA